MKYLIILCLFLVGCAPDDKTITKRQEERVEKFNKCMEMSSKITRQGDDDVSDIIKACDNVSYYQTVHVK